jgi:elongation factor G
MKEYGMGQLRNVVLLSHSGAGKTSLAEAMLYDTGAISRMGQVNEGTTVSDYDEEEIKREISLNLSLIPCEWGECKINLLDTPGYLDFLGEVRSGIRVADAALVVLDAVSGVEVGTELVWKHADERALPRLLVVNKLDRENADLNRVLAQLREKFEATFVLLQLPVGQEADLAGVIDLPSQLARMGANGESAEVPEELVGDVESAREQLIEAAAEGDDELLMKYLDGEELTDEEISRGLKARVAAGEVVPVLCASATANVGVIPLLEAMLAYLPSPAEVEPARATNPALSEEETIEGGDLAPLAALVFKTLADPYVGKVSYFRVYGGIMQSDSRLYNSHSREGERVGQLHVVRGKEQIAVDRVRAGDIGAVIRLSDTATGDTLCDQSHPLVLPGVDFPQPIYSVAVEPKTRADLAKISPSLTRLAEEDPTLEWHQEPSTRQTILSGMGDAHINIAVQRLASKYGLDVLTAVPKVPYLETITKTASTRYRHKKQTGGAGQFAEVYLRVEPRARGEGFLYEWEVFGGAVSSSFRPSIEKGIRQVMEQGVIAGYHVVDVLAAVYDGKEHPVDSKDIAFQIAGREVFKLAFMQAGPVLLEPIMDVTITIPDEYMGDVLGDLNTKRGRVQGVGQERGASIITAQVPLEEMQRYAPDLRSITQGRGLYSMTFSHHEEVPAYLLEDLIAQAKAEVEES